MAKRDRPDTTAPEFPLPRLPGNLRTKPTPRTGRAYARELEEWREARRRWEGDNGMSIPEYWSAVRARSVAGRGFGLSSVNSAYDPDVYVELDEDDDPRLT